MTAIARFEVIPIRDGSMSTAVARAVSALEQFPVSYETTATDTIIEGDTVAEVFAAVQAAHEAIPGDRVITSVEVDEVRGRQQGIHDRVASVERHLGHPPRRIRERPQQSPQQQPQQQQYAQQSGQQRFGQQPGQPSPQQPGQQRRPGRQRQAGPTAPPPQNQPQSPPPEPTRGRRTPPPR